jgi:hypothetical protein
MNTPTHKPDLEERLRSERPSFTPSAGFTEAVIERLGRQIAAPRRARASSRLFRVIAGVATAACVVLLALRIVPHPSAPPVLEPPPVAATPDLDLPTISFAQVGVLTAKLDEPLEAELRNVISDTRLAIQFVASNFLPEN